MFGGGGPVTAVRLIIIYKWMNGVGLPGCSFAREMSDFAGLFSYPP